MAPFSFNSSVSRQLLRPLPGDETELEENLNTRLLPPLRNGIWARTPEILAQTPPQATDLLKEIKCFALRESQREWHHGLAQVVFSTLQISSASLQCTHDAILNTCNLGAPHPLPNTSCQLTLSNSRLQTGKYITPTTFSLSSPGLRPSTRKR